MERPGYLIDTNAIIDYLGNALPTAGKALIQEVLDTKPCISIITKIEVLGYQKHAEHYQLLENFVNDVEVIELTSVIADRTISIRKTNKIKLPDAIIAATALTFGLTIITRNIFDFKSINGIKAINPHL